MSDNLDKIEDIVELCDIMKCFHLPTKGLNNSDDFKTKIRENLEKSSTRKVGEVHVSTNLILYVDEWAGWIILSTP